MKRPTIACVYFVHNDLAFLRATLPYEKKWADQICILDLGSTDGTQQFCEMYLDPGDKYQRRHDNTVPELGFAEATNAAFAMATTDWVFQTEADQMLHLYDHARIHDILGGATSPVLSMERINLLPIPKCGAHNIEAGIQRIHIPEATERELHRRLIRRDAGITSKGYIHEEPHLGEEHAVKVTAPSGLSMYHFGSWGKPGMHCHRKHWMLKNAMQNPALQKYTNSWWYTSYYPKTKDEINRLAAEYEEYVAHTGFK